MIVRRRWFGGKTSPDAALVASSVLRDLLTSSGGAQTRSHSRSPPTALTQRHRWGWQLKVTLWRATVLSEPSTKVQIKKRRSQKISCGGESWWNWEGQKRRSEDSAGVNFHESVGRGGCAHTQKLHTDAGCVIYLEPTHSLNHPPSLIQYQRQTIYYSLISRLCHGSRQ